MITYLKKNWIYIVMITAGLSFGAVYGAFLALSGDLPQIRSLEDFKPAAITRIYSADGVLLSEWYREKRDPVSLEDIPKLLITTLLTTEDRNFYSHNGIDLKGFFRAIIRNIIKGRLSQGASTITQQLARTFFLTQEKSITRKIKEAIIAFQLERRYTKNEILTFYLNQVYLGSGAYGVEAAARVYFDKPVTDLTLSQCAIIVGLLKGPHIYSPYVNMERCLQRRNIVLQVLYKTENISKDDYEKALKEVPVLPERRGRLYVAPYFLDYIRPQLEDLFGDAVLYNGGLQIYTTLNVKLQKAAETALKIDLDDLEKRMKANKIDDAPEGAIVSIHNKTGKILAMVGGKDYETSRYNRATQARRQPGSSFKPLVFAYAIEKGIQQNEILNDSPVVYKGGANGKDWRPQNFSRTYEGEMTIRKALAESKNIPAVRLLEKLGVNETKLFIKRFGIDVKADAQLSMVLGSSETDLLTLTSAYSVFPNKGNRAIPHGVDKVKDADGNTIFEWNVRSMNVISRDEAAVMTNLLEGVILEGTGKSARRLGRPLGGKTGTTDDYKDALFVGFSPLVSTGVWVGCDAPKPLGRGETGAKAALPAWIGFMEKALAEMPLDYFDIPDSVRETYMDPDTGELFSEMKDGSVKVLLLKR